jgi:hypothetical protein
MQTLAEPKRNLEHAFVAVDLDHVAHAIHHRSAALAPANVLLDGNAQRGTDLAIEIV